MLTAVEHKANLTALSIYKVKTEALIIPTPASEVTVTPPPLSISTSTISWATDFNYLGNTIADSETDL